MRYHISPFQVHILHLIQHFYIQMNQTLILIFELYQNILRLKLYKSSLLRPIQ
ncbi:hypothetical protein pb186bvf_000863 [Paramecium bursaria]